MLVSSELSQNLGNDYALLRRLAVRNWTRLFYQPQLANFCKSVQLVAQYLFIDLGRSYLHGWRTNFGRWRDQSTSRSRRSCKTPARQTTLCSIAGTRGSRTNHPEPSLHSGLPKYFLWKSFIVFMVQRNGYLMWQVLVSHRLVLVSFLIVQWGLVVSGNLDQVMIGL